MTFPARLIRPGWRFEERPDARGAGEGAEEDKLVGAFFLTRTVH